jgi:hypothetical protein
MTLTDVADRLANAHARALTVRLAAESIGVDGDIEADRNALSFISFEAADYINKLLADIDAARKKAA